MNNLKSIIESLLFISGAPISESRLLKLLKAKEGQLNFSGLNAESVLTCLKDMQSEYGQNGRGLRLVEKNGEWQMASAPENSEIVGNLIKSEFEEDLTKASLETLAIVAYKSPVSRAEIDDIRGVNSSFILRNLLIRGLIERIDNPRDARSYLYRPTFDFLKHLGLSKLDDLPNFNELNKKTDEIIAGLSAEGTPGVPEDGSLPASQAGALRAGAAGEEKTELPAENNSNAGEEETDASI